MNRQHQHELLELLWEFFSRVGAGNAEKYDDLLNRAEILLLQLGKIEGSHL